MSNKRETFPPVDDSRRMLKTLLGNLPGLVYRCRNDERWSAEFFSEGTLAITGYPAADFNEHRRHYADVVHPDDRDRVWEEVQAALARRERFTLTYRIVTASGAERWVDEQGCGVFGESGQLLALEGFITDVTERREADVARQENEQRLATLFESLPVPTWLEDFSAVGEYLGSLGLMGCTAQEVEAYFATRPEALAACVARVRILDVNREALRFHGASDKAELLAGLDRIVTLDSTTALLRQLTCITTGAERFEIDSSVRTLAGEPRQIHLCWSACAGAKRDLSRVIVSTLDITEQRRTQDEALLLQTLARGIAEAEDESKALDFVLRHVCETAGWAFGEAWRPSPTSAGLQCDRVWSRATPGLEEFARLTRTCLFAPGEGLPGTVRAGAKPIWIEDVSQATNFPRREAAVQAGLKAALGVPVLAKGEIVLVLGFFLHEPRPRDQQFVSILSAAATQIGLLIERKRATDALVREQALAVSTLRSLPGVFYLFDAAGRLMRWNDNFARATGYAPDELRGKTPFDFLAPEEHVLVSERITEVFAKGHSAVEATLLARDGTRTPYYFTGERVELDGQPHLVGSGFDLSSLRQARESLTRSLEEFASLHSLGRQLVVEPDLAHLISAAIKAAVVSTKADFVVLFRHGPDGLTPLGSGPADAVRCAIHTPCLHVGECLCGHAASQRTPHYCHDILHDHRCNRCECKDAGLRSFASLPLLVEGELIGVLGLGSVAVRDFSGQSLFLEAIASTISLSLRNANLLEQVRQHATELERESEGRRKAEAAMRLQASALEATANAIMITDRDGLIQWVNPAWTRLTGYPAAEVIGQNPRILKSGRQDQAFYAGFWSRILSGEVVQGVVVNRRKDGTLYHEHETITPLTDAAGRITHFIAIKQDITEQLALEEQLRQSQKMDAIGQLAGGVAHDFNNLLTVIQGNASIARMSDATDGERLAALDDIGSATARAATLTRQLLAFSRRQEIQPRTLDLNEAVTGITRMLQRLIGEDVQLLLRLHSRPVFVRADPGMIDQVLMNLAVNARDAMPSGGELTIATCLVQPGGERHHRHPEMLPTTQACLRVVDTGCGIPPEVISRIFEPFFTTKGPGKGTGLGLATVFGIVRQHGGFIDVTSEPGAGTTFEVLLPLDESNSTNEAMGVSRDTPTANGETILVVEDEDAVRRLTVRMLETHGYLVLDAPDGPTALQIAAAHPEIDLLLTDMIMPGGLDGQQVANRIRENRPGLPVVFMSGYTPDRIRRDQNCESNCTHLEKPFTAGELFCCVSASLDICA
ncbi:MAG: PAS domain S-box protein [Verrucomicrobia bacterium]|nr:PAS domain S-box protein [Verrucomicrobiota bacterium]